MDIASILNELSRRRLWVGIGIVVAGVVALSMAFTLPSLERKSTVTSAASTDVLVDTRSSALGSIAIEVEELTTRAAVYAGMIGTTEVKQRIARSTGVRVDRIGVLDMGVGAPGATDAPGRPLRSASPDDILIGATVQEGTPAVKLQAIAPSPAAARRLADASAQALVSYVAGVQELRDVRPRERVVLRQLGPPQTVVLVDEPGLWKSLAVFFAILLAWCLLVLAGSRVAAALRELRAPESPRAPEGGQLLIGRWDKQPADGRFGESSARREIESPSRAYQAVRRPDRGHR